MLRNSYTIGSVAKSAQNFWHEWVVMVSRSQVDVDLASRVKAAADLVPGAASLIAEALGIDRSNVSRMLSGQRGIGAAELITVADVLQVPLLELLGRAQPPLIKLAARLAADPQDDLAVVRRRAAQLLELRAGLSRFMTEPKRERQVVEVPHGSYEKGNGIQLAENTRRALGLDDGPIDDLTALIEDQFDIDVASQPMRQGLAGILVRESADDGTAMMLVNSDDFFGRQRTTLAHELGHFLFGDGEDELVYADYTRPAQGDRREMRANVFAVHFLLPESAARRAAALNSQADPSKDPAVRLVGELAGTHGLSVEATANHLNNLGLLTDHDRDRVCSSPRKRDVYVAGGTVDWFDESDSKTNAIVPPSSSAEMALSAYQHGLVGISTVGDVFATDDLEGLAQDLAAAGWAPDFS
jgi:Zn-dependent peptidase ImmA (M78 family)/transcriptional regulator with XRE-family HTH domain